LSRLKPKQFASQVLTTFQHNISIGNGLWIESLGAKFCMDECTWICPSTIGTLVGEIIGKWSNYDEIAINVPRISEWWNLTQAHLCEIGVYEFKVLFWTTPRQFNHY
jgi:hypothetical protein